MERLSAEEFMAQVLQALEDLSPELRKGLLQASGLPSTVRVQQLKAVFEEAASG